MKKPPRPNLLSFLLIFTSLLSSTFCSWPRFNFHLEGLLEDDLLSSIKDDPLKIQAYNEKIVPWLAPQLPANFLVSFDLLDRLDRSLFHSSELPSVFRDKKMLFELAERLINENLTEIAVKVVKYTRASVFFSSTYDFLLASLNRPTLSVFHTILKLWFPNAVDLVTAIHNLVHLQLGEDDILVFIDIVWDRIVAVFTAEELKSQFLTILISAMQRHYVSVFEDILERIPGLIQYHALNSNKNTLLHIFARNCDSDTLNKLFLPKKTLRRSLLKSSGDSVGHNDEGLSLTMSSYSHLSRSYPAANQDLLAAMLEHGAELNATDKHSMTPLFLAIYLGNAPIVKVLLEAGADHHVKYRKQGLKQFFKAYYSKAVEDVLLDFFRK